MTTRKRIPTLATVIAERDHARAENRSLLVFLDEARAKAYGLELQLQTRPPDLRPLVRDLYDLVDELRRCVADVRPLLVKPAPPPPPGSSADKRLQYMAGRIGSVGGTARAATLTPARRSAIAKQAARARWKKR